MTTQAVRPGQLLAGRYRVEDLLDEVGGVRSWRAVDEVLSRAVFVHTVPTDDPRADALVAAARAASQVGDPRFLQVLDVDAEADTVYVVREWITGQNLKALLAGGPLNAEQAATLGRELAQALASAHAQGLTHLRLEPSSVVVAPNGSVKVAGLATEAALHGVPDADPGQADAAGIGRILYAALTGRWPDSEGHGLPIAPRIDGRFASPRQVRPGVPRHLDEVVDRTLGNADRHHATQLLSPAEVADALSSGTAASTFGNGALSDSSDDGWPPPAVLDEPAAPLIANRAVPTAQSMPPRSGGSTTARRVLGVLAATAFLLVVAWVGLQLLLSGVSTPDRTVSDDSAPSETAAEAEDEQTTPPQEDEQTTPPQEDEPEEITISLTADPTSVAGSQRITLSGAIEPAQEGVVLRVERRLGGGDWSGFPDSNNPVTTTTQAGGDFSTWVQTGRTGENEWRLVGEVDGEEIASSTVSVTVD
ncbi:MAG TPA: protein kinase family protein [Jiangellaceae bacterium]|nr:protein kinase family protein [Jiangellaceae bacterium]